MVKVEILALVLSIMVLQDSVSALFDGCNPINNLNDPHVVEIAKFALSEINNQINTRPLKLKSVDQGCSQVVAGLSYLLRISTMETMGLDLIKKFEVLVWEKAGSGDKKLISFKPINA
ncbi:Cystatin domain [Dillenia turbinata]|uniref:Cystatin domain n=1 Tax=Dillenia turbinata TaxID=194707 RepID=A0AAN8Z3W3_9MAGN